METNNIVVMIDDEIARLDQVRQILQSLTPDDILLAAADSTVREAAQAGTPPVRHVSRRGISTGSRGVRRRTASASPRALDAAVPRGPVVIAPADRPMLQAPIRQEPPSPAASTHKLDTLLAAAFASSQQTATA